MSVIIVGAGAGGIATAARLSQQGFEVKVIEKHDFIGGRCSLIHKDGYRFDQGPSLLMMRELFDETFRDLGSSLEQEGVELLKCEPNYCIWFADRDVVELSTDLSRLRAMIQRYEGVDGFPRFCAFLREAGVHYDLSLRHVLRKTFPSLLSMLRVDVLKSIVSLHPWESTYSRASRYFLSEKMRRVWTFATMYLGMSPYAAPSTYSLLQYIETVDGIWYPSGGFNTVLKALARIGEKSGVKYILNSPVESILLSDTGSATGVRLASGTELHADTVVINADLVYAYNELLPPSPQSRKLKQRPASCSSISFFWGFSESLPYLQTHNVFLADEYRESFDAIFAHHQIPNDPSFYVNVPSRIDSSAAPCDKETVVVLVPVGHLTPTQTEEEWNDLVTRTRDKVLNIIESRTGLHSLRSKIVHEIVHTPVTWEKRFNLDRGAILGLSHSFFNVLCFRPQMKHPRIGGLYFVGASTHPGTGVPVCLAGSKLVTRLIVQDWNSTGSRSGILAVLLSVMVVLISFWMWM